MNIDAIGIGVGITKEVFKTIFKKTSIVTITAINEKNMPIRGVVIVLGNKHETTVASGKAIFENMKPGRYNISVQYSGKNESNIDVIYLESNTQSNITLTLNSSLFVGSPKYQDQSSDSVRNFIEDQPQQSKPVRVDSNNHVTIPINIGWMLLPRSLATVALILSLFYEFNPWVFSEKMVTAFSMLTFIILLILYVLRIMYIDSISSPKNLIVFLTHTILGCVLFHIFAITEITWLLTLGANSHPTLIAAGCIMVTFGMDIALIARTKKHLMDLGM